MGKNRIQKLAEGCIATLRQATFLSLLFFAGFCPASAEELILRISDWQSGQVYIESPAKANSRLFFGWIHSLDKIPWNEHFHIDDAGQLILDSISFPAFAAGIPEAKGRRCRVADGLIYMEDIGQVFTELVWLNSHTATQDIVLDGVEVARGNSLPQHRRLRLVIEKR